ncbi:MAG: hypothetical protein VB144_11410 [Clostridia bacterium]|nr:hypothetical protein [Clostridia bacterium]
MKQGDTIWIRGTFHGRDGQPYDPTDVVLRIYDGSRKLIKELTPARIDVGCYEAPYTLPLGDGALTYEFSGVDAEGLTQLDRGNIQPPWV